MNGEHRIRLHPETILTPHWALTAVTAASRHILYGPEVLLVRTVTLTCLRDAKFAVLTSMTPAQSRQHRVELGEEY